MSWHRQRTAERKANEKTKWRVLSSLRLLPSEFHSTISSSQIVIVSNESSLFCEANATSWKLRGVGRTRVWFLIRKADLKKRKEWESLQSLLFYLLLFTLSSFLFFSLALSVLSLFFSCCPFLLCLISPSQSPNLFSCLFSLLYSFLWYLRVLLIEHNHHCFHKRIAQDDCVSNGTVWENAKKEMWDIWSSIHNC